MSESSQREGAGPDSNQYSTRHDWESDRRIAITITEALADHAGVSPLELPPLYDSIDPEALDSLVRGPDAEGQAHVTFPVAGSEYHVTVHGDGGIEIDG